MIDRILTDQEQEINGKVAQAFYYSPATIDSFPSEVNSLLAGLGEESKQLIRETITSSLSFEQAQRRDYLVSSLKNAIFTDNKSEQEIILRAVVSVSGDQLATFVTSSNLGCDVAALEESSKDPQLGEQLRLYNLIASRLDAFSLDGWAIKIKPIYDLLSKKDEEYLTELTGLIDRYYADYAVAIDQETTAIIDIPQALYSSLEKGGLAIIVEKDLTLPERLARLLIINTTAKILLNSQRSGEAVDGATLMKAIAGLTIGFQNLVS